MYHLFDDDWNVVLLDNITDIAAMITCHHMSCVVFLMYMNSVVVMDFDVRCIFVRLGVLYIFVVTRRCITLESNGDNSCVEILDGMEKIVHLKRHSMCLVFDHCCDVCDVV